MHFIPGLRLRASEEAEILGIDDVELGEFTYDYVGIDIGQSHEFRDDTHSHGVCSPPGRAGASHGLCATCEGMRAVRWARSRSARWWLVSGAYLSS